MKKDPDLTRLNISLTRDQREYVCERAVEYGSASEYMRELIRKDERQRAEEKLEALLIEGLDSGPAVRGGKEYFAKLRARIGAMSKAKPKKGRRK